MIVRSRNGVPIRLTEERWEHIIRGHPEMVEQRQRVLETIAEPDAIQEGDFGALLARRFFEETPLTRKLLVVAYKETAPDDALFSRPISRVVNRAGG